MPRLLPWPTTTLANINPIPPQVLPTCAPSSQSAAVSTYTESVGAGVTGIQSATNLAVCPPSLSQPGWGASENVELLALITHTSSSEQFAASLLRVNRLHPHRRQRQVFLQLLLLVGDGFRRLYIAGARHRPFLICLYRQSLRLGLSTTSWTT